MTSTLEPRENWIRLGKGRHRVAWLLPSGYVLKIPHERSGKEANEREAETWKNRHNPDLLGSFKDWAFARCRMIGKTGCLLMEFVKPCADSAQSQRETDSKESHPAWSHNAADIRWEDLPPWCKKVDCEQVGFNRKGDLVAYDFAE